MANLVDTTIYNLSPAGGTTVTVALHSPATAGMTLVLVALGGATVTAKLTNSSGTSFTKRTAALGTQECGIHDVVCAGGETQVFLTLSSNQNISGIIYHFSSLGAFIAASNNGSGTTTSISGATDDWLSPSSAIAVSQNAVLVGAWTAPDSTNPHPGFRNMGPLGHLYATQANQPGSLVQFIWASGLADITAAKSFPPELSAGNYKATSTWVASAATSFAAQAAYADSSGVATNPVPVNKIVAENSLPGSHKNNWYLSNTAASNATIAGFCDKLSYAAGDTVNFKVDSTGNPFRVEIYRTGYYGWDQLSARNVLTSKAGAVYITGSIVSQPSPVVDGTLGSTSCAGWTSNASWTIPSDAPSGVYTVIFRRTDVTTNAAGAIFVVRPSSCAGKIAVVIDDFTQHAYNVWGATTDNGALVGGTWTGRSLYQIGTDAGTANNAHRAYAVCFDRPLGTTATNLATSFYDAEHGLITFMEAQGYDVVYYSCIDLENDTTATLLNQAKLVCFIGHQEYVTTNMYNSLTAAANAGVPFMINSADTCGWHTRFASADTNKRTMICYKDSLSVDATVGFDAGSGIDPVSYTGTWRDSRTSSPNNTDIRRENALTGQIFEFSGPSGTKQGVPFASKGLPIWRNSASVQALTTGQTYNHTQTTSDSGFELDGPDGSTGQPPNLVQLNPQSTGALTSGTNAAGSIYSTHTTATMSWTLYRRTGSRALVFNTGAWRAWWFVCRYALASFAGGGAVVNPDVNWQNAFLALMYDLGCPPVTIHAQQDVFDTALTDPATNAPANYADKTAIARAYGLTCPEDNQFAAFTV